MKDYNIIEVKDPIVGKACYKVQEKPAFEVICDNFTTNHHNYSFSVEASVEGYN